MNSLQTQKLIQETVRVKSSLYTMNLASLSSYQNPIETIQVINNYVVPPNTNWNQMSDRVKPSLQTVRIPTRGNSTKSSVTSNRPGAMSPGGAGVDIKHNSYERRLLKLKGESILRKKIGKPAIINNCPCL
jgi:hypothetical protein